LFIDLSIESGVEDTVSGTGGQGNTVESLWVLVKKQNSSTPILQESGGQKLASLFSGKNLQ
jgi:hypothetical protein